MGGVMGTITTALTIFACLLSFHGNSLWQRHIQSGKGDAFDTPEPHPLAYFTADPFLRDDGDQFCSVCTPEGKATVHTEHTFTVETRHVGALHGFEIYDVYYRFDDHVGTSKIDWKSILVKVGPDQFREIYHLQPTDAIITPSHVLNAVDEKILATHDVIPGTGNYYYEDYFWFSAAGPERIDIERITKEVQSILPDGLGVWKGGGLDMISGTYLSQVWKEGDANCCPTGGTVILRFRLDGSHIFLLSKSYDPNGKIYELP